MKLLQAYSNRHKTKRYNVAMQCNALFTMNLINKLLGSIFFLTFFEYVWVLQISFIFLKWAKQRDS